MSTFSATDPGCFLGNYFKGTTRFLKKYLFEYFVSEFWDLVITQLLEVSYIPYKWFNTNLQALHWEFLTQS